MNKHTPYNILLVLAVAVTGLMVYYNLVLRRDFAITISYAFPQVDPSESPDSQQEQQNAWTPPEPRYVYDDYLQEEPETVVLVTFPLEINTATVDELMYIPRVGSVMAQRIVQYRDVLGGFTDLAQLGDIQGIGETTLETISQYLYIEGQWSPEELPAAEDEAAGE